MRITCPISHVACPNHVDTPASVDGELVCDLACAERWAKRRGRVLSGESRSYGNGASAVSYRTCAPEQFNRKVHAPINEKPPS